MTPPEEAIVLAGGRGTRLQSAVRDVPKPLAAVAGRPFLAWILDHLAAHGIARVILATGYMAEKIEAAIGNEWKSMAVDYSVEPAPLGTGGAVRLASRRLQGDSAHVLNGDTFLDYDPRGLARAVLGEGAAIGIALASVDDVSRYGAVECERGRVQRFREKGGRGRGHVNAGSYFLSPAALAALPDAESFSFETEVLAPMAMEGRVLGYDRTSRFIDIGIPEDYLRAQSHFSGEP